MSFEWKPIETAPKDQTCVLLWVGKENTESGMIIAFWGDEDADNFDPAHWWFEEEWHGNTIGGAPTHWCSLPDAPSDAPE